MQKRSALTAGLVDRLGLDDRARRCTLDKINADPHQVPHRT